MSPNIIQVVDMDKKDGCRAIEASGKKKIKARDGVPSRLGISKAKRVEWATCPPLIVIAKPIKIEKDVDRKGW